MTKFEGPSSGIEPGAVLKDPIFGLFPRQRLREGLQLGRWKRGGGGLKKRTRGGGGATLTSKLAFWCPLEDVIIVCFYLVIRKGVLLVYTRIILYTGAYLLNRSNSASVYQPLSSHILLCRLSWVEM